MNRVLSNCPLTLNTTRICGSNPVETALGVSRIGFTNMKPNVVILVNKEEVFDGIAAAPLVHFPINAALLFTDGSRLSREVLNEIARLSPKGYRGIHVFLMGNISKNVSMELNGYGLRTYHIAGRNHYETACKIPAIRKEYENILIISGEDYSEGISAAYWSAHHGDPILFVQRNGIPACTLEAIRKSHDINIYILGSSNTVPKTVENTLSKLPNVKHLSRIDGANPYEIAVNFAKFKDPKTNFGWGRNYRDGHAFTFSTLNHPMETIAGILFAHMGKHTPLLLIKKDSIPSVVESYIKSVKPMPPKDMPRPPFMHGFILGDTSLISYPAQVMLEGILSIDHEIMDMDTMDNMHHVHIMHHMDHDTEDSQNTHESTHRIGSGYSYDALSYKFQAVNQNEITE
jgi:putative cell wall-binding protein